MRFLYTGVIILLLTACNQQDLLNNLNQQQANEVLAVLQKNNIAGEKKDKGKSGYTIVVSIDDFPAAVDWLKVYNLPGRPDVEISQMFPADALVSSPRAEKARLYSAIEQRLEQSLKIMDGILASRVHVSYDVEGSDNERQVKPTHISVLAVYDQGIDPEQKVNDIKRFMVNSFSDVDYDNISVILSKRDKIQQVLPTDNHSTRMPGGKDSVYIIIITVLLIILLILSLPALRKIIYFDQHKDK